MPTVAASIQLGLLRHWLRVPLCAHPLVQPARQPADDGYRLDGPIRPIQSDDRKTQDEIHHNQYEERVPSLQTSLPIPYFADFPKY